MRPISLSVDHRHHQPLQVHGQQMEDARSPPTEPIHLTPKFDSKPRVQTILTPSSVVDSVATEGDVPIQSVEQLIQARRSAGATLAGRRQISDGALMAKKKEMRSPTFDASSPVGNVKLVGRRVTRRMTRSRRSNSAKDLRNEEKDDSRTPPRPTRKSASMHEHGISKERHDEILKKLKIPTSPEEDRTSITIKQVRQGNKVLVVRRSIKRRPRGSRNEEQGANKSTISISQSIEPELSPPIIGTEIVVNNDDLQDEKCSEDVPGRNWESRRRHSLQHAGESSSSSLQHPGDAKDKKDRTTSHRESTRIKKNVIHEASPHSEEEDIRSKNEGSNEEDETIQLVRRKKSVLKTEIEVMRKNFNDAGKYANNCILVNHERTSRGLCALQRNVALDELASDYAKQVAESAGKGKITSTYHGNIMRGPSIRAVHAAMMEREHQRTKIINPLFREFGVGTIKKDGLLYVCQLFSESVELECEDFDT